MNWPPMRRAYSQLKSAVRTPPMCSRPVGLGAKRVMVVMDSESGGARMVAALTGPHQHARKGRNSIDNQEDPSHLRRPSELHEGGAAVPRHEARGLVPAADRAHRPALRL